MLKKYTSNLKHILRRIEKKIDATNEKQIQLQVGIFLVTLTLSYFILGLTVLMTIFHQIADVFLATVCFALSMFFLILTLIKPKWLFKKY